jgi:sugar lactone lactonase YvrE
VALNEAGNLFIADTRNSRIRKIDDFGTITTVAGSDSVDFSGDLGDGGPATEAALRLPYAVTVDETGDIYIADTNNHRIRRVDPFGIIETVAGNGSFGSTGDGGPAIEASLASPRAVAVDTDGNLFIADRFNLRKVDTSGIITAFPFTGAFFNARGLAIDETGNLYVSVGHRVRKVDPSGLITTVAGNGSDGFSGDGGPATSASLNAPSGLAIDAAGNLYIADKWNHRIRKVDISGIITTVAGDGTRGFGGDGGPAIDAYLNSPVGVAVDADGNLYIADLNNSRIRKVVFTPEGMIENLEDTVINLGLQEGIENSLLAKLDTALQTLADGNENNDVAVVNALEAFINAVEAQRGKKIDEPAADQLIAVAEMIVNLLRSQ